MLTSPQNRPHGCGRSRADAGFTLIEVLIAVLLLSIGLLGLAGLQMASLKNNGSAMNRSQATWIAYDVLDRMRANRTAALNGDYDIALGATAPSGSSRTDVDLQAWKNELSSLPGGDGAVKTSSNTVTVLVRWSDASDKMLNTIGPKGSAPVATCSDFSSPSANQQQICFKTDL